MAKHKQWIEIMDGVEEKQCTRCKVWKPLDQYAKDKKGVGGRRASCKECVNTYSKSLYYNQYKKGLSVCARKGCNETCKTARAKYCSQSCANVERAGRPYKSSTPIDPKWLTRGTPSTSSGMDGISNGS